MTRIQGTILLFIYFIISEKSHKVFSLSYVVFYLQEIRIVAFSDHVYCSHYALKKNICINWKNVVVISYLYVYITVLLQLNCYFIINSYLLLS